MMYIRRLQEVTTYILLDSSSNRDMCVVNTWSPLVSVYDMYDHTPVAGFHGAFHWARTRDRELVRIHMAVYCAR